MATTNARSPTEEPEPLEEEPELLEEAPELLEEEPELLEEEPELELEDEEPLEDDELFEGSAVLVPPPQPASATDANASMSQRENRSCFELVIELLQDCLLTIDV
jgi:hypothetical protein